MEHYFSKKPDSELDLQKIKVNVLGLTFEIYTGSGVFSKSRLDPASRLLIETCIVKPKMKVLDLGCGYGIVGVSLMKLDPSLKFTFSDVNERALNLTKKNLKLNKLDGDVIDSNIYDSIKGAYDNILVNPPQKAGKEICEKMITQAPKYIKAGGYFQLVARHNRGGSGLEKVMKATFGNVRPLAKSGGFRVYCSEKTK